MQILLKVAWSDNNQQIFWWTKLLREKKVRKMKNSAFLEQPVYAVFMWVVITLLEKINPHQNNVKERWSFWSFKSGRSILMKKASDFRRSKYEPKLFCKTLKCCMKNLSRIFILALTPSDGRKFVFSNSARRVK